MENSNNQMAKVKQRNKRTILHDLLSFQSSLNGKSELVDKLRLEGAEEVQNTSFPHPKDEDCRFITLRDLYSDSFVPPENVDTDLPDIDRKSTRLNSSHVSISYAVS